ncbi:Rhodanese-like domain-containing protein [Powellomyces hirtus]|nr:Rhodanese-like domain-containing protein [Powellomyces hirtus]
MIPATRSIALVRVCKSVASKYHAVRPFSQTAAANSLFTDYINSLKSSTKEISPSELNKKLVADPVHGPNGLHVLDVREPYEWNEEKLPYAEYTGRGMLEASIEKRFPNPDHEFVLYCASGNRSLIAAESLTAMGYKKVYSLRGGIGAWKNEGFVTSQNFRNLSGFN